MKLVLSRKGFDTASGGAPSPVVRGRPLSLPIPAPRGAPVTYADLGLGAAVEAATRDRIPAATPCHQDPMFEAGRCAFGQAGAAQTHLANQGIGPGDTFLFFGLFAGPGRTARHHRIFGCLRVEAVVPLGPRPGPGAQPAGFPRTHPHVAGNWPANNTLYLGPGRTARTAPDTLRLTCPEGPAGLWRIPPWLAAAGLSYHARPDRWERPGYLRAVSRGQEFVTDIAGRPEAQAWLETILAAFRAPGEGPLAEPR